MTPGLKAAADAVFAHCAPPNAEQTAQVRAASAGAVSEAMRQRESKQQEEGGNAA